MNTKKQIIQDLTFISINVALAIIILSISYLLPFSSLFLMIFMPISASLVAIRTRFKSQLLYLIALLAITFINLQEGLFYLLPNALIGLVFGFLCKHNFSPTIKALSLITSSFILSLLVVYPIQWIFQINIIDVYATLLKIDYDKFTTFFPVFTFALSCGQSAITFDIINSELKKFVISSPKNNDFYFYFGGSLVFSFLAYAMKFISPTWAYLFVAINMLFLAGLIIFLAHYRHKLTISLMSGAGVIALFIFLFYSSFTPLENTVFGLNFCSLPFLLLGSLVIINQLIVKKEKINFSLFENNEI